MSQTFQLMADLPAFFYSVVFVLSLIVGSFLNVVIHRLPIMMERGWKREFQSYFTPDEIDEDAEPYNLVKPDSTCPKCGHTIRWYENIPVISWLVLGRKCSNCKTPISARYPTVELMTALLSLWVAYHFGFGWQAAIGILATWFLVAMTCIDLDKMLLPDQLTLPFLWIGLLASTVPVFNDPSSSIIGAAAGYLCLWSLFWAFKLLTGKEGMGYGDFKLLAALGALLGWQQLPVIILMSSFVGAIIGITMIVAKGQDKSQPIPFGPYLAIAGWLSMLYGNDITRAYFNWIGL